MVDKIDRFSGDFRFLSNFGECAPFTHEGITYTTTEHFYQAMKTTDLGERQRIAKLPTPGQAKKAGSLLKLRSDWNIVREDMMKLALSYKFVPGSLCAELLLATGDVPLIEGNAWGDLYWGVSIKTGLGENRLGKLLMERRRELQK